jgi:Rha family phage regulatory protein
MPQSTQVAHGAITLTVIDGIPTTTSNQVAQHFGKRHERVLDAARTLIAELPADAQHNFVLSEYTDCTGRSLPAYRLTRDGFTLLAMGFTGKKALAFKLAYIDAFNAMERQLHPLPPTTAAPAALPERPRGSVAASDTVRQLKAAADSLVQAALHAQEAANTIARANGGVGSALWLNPPPQRHGGRS